jgi:hypothetical protein
VLTAAQSFDRSSLTRSSDAREYFEASRSSNCSISSRVPQLDKNRAHAAPRKALSCLSQPPIWFQLANVRLTSSKLFIPNVRNPDPKWDIEPRGNEPKSDGNQR